MPWRIVLRQTTYCFSLYYRPTFLGPSQPRLSAFPSSFLLFKGTPSEGRPVTSFSQLTNVLNWEAQQYASERIFRHLWLSSVLQTTPPIVVFSSLGPLSEDQVKPAFKIWRFLIATETAECRRPFLRNQRDGTWTSFRILCLPFPRAWGASETRNRHIRRANSTLQYLICAGPHCRISMPNIWAAITHDLSWNQSVICWQWFRHPNQRIPFKSFYELIKKCVWATTSGSTHGKSNVILRKNSKNFPRAFRSYQLSYRCNITSLPPPTSKAFAFHHNVHTTLLLTNKTRNCMDHCQLPNHLSIEQKRSTSMISLSFSFFLSPSFSTVNFWKNSPRYIQ